MRSPMYRQAQAAFDAPTCEICALPKVGVSLRWVEGEDVFVVGANAALELGPGARNLMGAMRGAKAVAEELHGLMWTRVAQKQRRTMVANIFELLGTQSDEEASEDRPRSLVASSSCNVSLDACLSSLSHESTTRHGSEN